MSNNLLMSAVMIFEIHESVHNIQYHYFFLFFFCILSKYMSQFLLIMPCNYIYWNELEIHIF